MPRTIRLSTHIDAPYERVAALVMQPATLIHVSAPLLRFVPVDRPLPRVWENGVWRVLLRGPLGLPLGWQEIRVTFPEPPNGGLALRDNGHGALAERWDHWIEIVPEKDGVRYTDTVTVEAGWRTFAVAGFARLFYAHRQRRWRRLVQDHA